MEITFQSNKLQKIFSSPSSLLQKYGIDRGKAIMRRISFIRSAQNLAEIPSEPPTRRHQLLGKRSGQFALDISKNYRLIFEPNHKPLLKKKDGGLDLTRITSIKILQVEDYH